MNMRQTISTTVLASLVMVGGLAALSPTQARADGPGPKQAFCFPGGDPFPYPVDPWCSPFPGYPWWWDLYGCGYGGGYGFPSGGWGGYPYPYPGGCWDPCGPNYKVMNKQHHNGPLQHPPIQTLKSGGMAQNHKGNPGQHHPGLDPKPLFKGPQGLGGNHGKLPPNLLANSIRQTNMNPLKHNNNFPGGNMNMPRNTGIAGQFPHTKLNSGFPGSMSNSSKSRGMGNFNPSGFSQASSRSGGMAQNGGGRRR